MQLEQEICVLFEMEKRDGGYVRASHACISSRAIKKKAFLSFFHSPTQSNKQIIVGV
jgi:hypothetical protein